MLQLSPLSWFDHPNNTILWGLPIKNLPIMLWCHLRRFVCVLSNHTVNCYVHLMQMINEWMCMWQRWDDTDSGKLNSSDKKSYLNDLVHHNPTSSDKVQNITEVFSWGLSYNKIHLKTEVSFSRHHQILYSTCRRKRKSANPVDLEVDLSIIRTYNSKAILTAFMILTTDQLNAQILVF